MHAVVRTRSDVSLRGRRLRGRRSVEREGERIKKKGGLRNKASVFSEFLNN
jgi:hypothetical protein